ncbi:MAG: hypothetical protein QM820_13330 [Minicystis sp.]
MSETTPDATAAVGAEPAKFEAAEPAKTEAAEPAKAEPAKIDFDRAEFATPGGEHVACGVCKREITTEYWQFLGKILCDTCREAVRRSADGARGGATFGKAFLLGGGAALGCGIGYAIFVGVTHIQFALVTIGIGWAVGRVIQNVTRGFGSRRHQVLAVALTYFATSMGYFPAVLGALSKSSGSAEQGAAPSIATATPSSAAASTAAPPADAPPTMAPGREFAPAPASTAAATGTPPAGGNDAAPQHGILFSLVVFTVGSLLFTLLAPILDITGGLSGILGALIIFFGLRTAWRVSQGAGGTITGPHKVAASAGS